jgi:hypothetical protein
MATTEIRKGQLVRITQPRRDHTVRFFALVRWTKEIDAGTYFGYEPVEPPRGQHGMPRHACAVWGCSTVHREPLPYSATVEVWPVPPQDGAAVAGRPT